MTGEGYDSLMGKEQQRILETVSTTTDLRCFTIMSAYDLARYVKIFRVCPCECACGFLSVSVSLAACACTFASVLYDF